MLAASVQCQLHLPHSPLHKLLLFFLKIYTVTLQLPCGQPVYELIKKGYQRHWCESQLSWSSKSLLNSNSVSNSEGDFHMGHRTRVGERLLILSSDCHIHPPCACSSFNSHGTTVDKILECVCVDLLHLHNLVTFIQQVSPWLEMTQATPRRE